MPESVSPPANPALLEVLQQRFPDSSRTTLRQLLAHDRVLVNGQPERNARRTIGPVDRVELPGRGARIDPHIRILFEDADLIVVEKAAGILTVRRGEGSGTGTEPDVESLLNAALSAGAGSKFGARPRSKPGSKPGSKSGPGAGASRIQHVHRLDRDASGLLVFARNAFARERLQEQFAAHTTVRVYEAVVAGRFDPPTGTMRSYLAEDRDGRVRSVADPIDGKLAVTHYCTLEAGSHFALMEVTLETGRRNQIRVHFAEADHPIVGDAMYGPAGVGAGPIGRLGLHARLLGFVHPRGNRRVEFVAEAPKAFRELVKP